MFDDLLKKSEELIKWWKLELGVTLISFSFLTVIVGVSTEWSIPSLEEPINTSKMFEEIPLLVVVVVTLIVLIVLIAVSVFKSFKVLNSFNQILRVINEERIKNVLKKSKILLSSIICLTIFPLLMLLPQLSGVLAFGIIVCKFLFYKNNKEIYNLINKTTNQAQ